MECIGDQQVTLRPYLEMRDLITPPGRLVFDGA
jgi:hypothetical protein